MAPFYCAARVLLSHPNTRRIFCQDGILHKISGDFLCKMPPNFFPKRIDKARVLWYTYIIKGKGNRKMKKLTKNFAKEILSDNNYIDGLAYVAERVARYKTYAGRISELDRLQEKLLSYAEEFEDGESDYIDNVYAISSGIWCAIDADDED